MLPEVGSLDVSAETQSGKGPAEGEFHLTLYALAALRFARSHEPHFLDGGRTLERKFFFWTFLKDNPIL